MITQLPPCGIYKTLGPVGSIPGGRLVYFHNHGEPGAGIYVPSAWKGNRAQWSDRGVTLPSPEDIRLLEPLTPEGFFRVTTAFECCEKRCRRYEPEQLVQLGYNGEAQPILFVPELVDGVLTFPERGSRIERDRFSHLKALSVAQGKQTTNPHGGHVH